MSRLRADFLLLLTALVWGAAFVGQSTAMEHLGPFAFTGLRFAIATLAVLPFVIAEARKGPALPSHLSGPIIGVGLVFFIASATQQVGLLATTVTNAGFLTALYVVFVPAVAFLALRQKPPFVVWPAAALSLTGTWFLGGGLSGLNWGDGIMVFSALFWALQVILVGAVAQRSNRPITVAAIQFAVAAALSLIIALVVETTSLDGILAAWRELLFTGLISGGLGFTLQAIAQRHTPASDAAIIMSSEALFAALFGMALLSEQLDTWGIIGCTLIFSAVLIVQLVPFWRPNKRLN